MQRLALAAHYAAFLGFALPAAAQVPDASTAADWKRDVVCYEIFVRSFFDSDGDGIGDLNGLIHKLDYINDGTRSTRRHLGPAASGSCR